MFGGVGDGFGDGAGDGGDDVGVAGGEFVVEGEMHGAVQLVFDPPGDDGDGRLEVPGVGGGGGAVEVGAQVAVGVAGGAHDVGVCGAADDVGEVLQNTVMQCGGELLAGA